MQKRLLSGLLRAIFQYYSAYYNAFGHKNAGTTYQRAITAIYYDMLHDFLEDYVEDIVVKSRGTITIR